MTGTIIFNAFFRCYFFLEKHHQYFSVTNESNTEYLNNNIFTFKGFCSLIYFLALSLNLILILRNSLLFHWHQMENLQLYN